MGSRYTDGAHKAPKGHGIGALFRSEVGPQICRFGGSAYGQPNEQESGLERALAMAGNTVLWSSRLWIAYSK